MSGGCRDESQLVVWCTAQGDHEWCHGIVVDIESILRTVLIADMCRPPLRLRPRVRRHRRGGMEGSGALATNQVFRSMCRERLGEGQQILGQAPL